MTSEVEDDDELGVGPLYIPGFTADQIADGIQDGPSSAPGYIRDSLCLPMLKYGSNFRMYVT